MEAVVKKYQSKYRKVREYMTKWDDLQNRLLSLFGNAVSIIERLQMLMEPKTYGGLRCINGVKETLVGKQMEMLERIISLMKEAMEEFHDIVISLNKISGVSHQQLKGGSSPNVRQMQFGIGIHPSLAFCVDGLKAIYEMHQSEYLLKSSLISALKWEFSSSDMIALRQLLADQPNVPKDEVQLIFDTIFAEEIS